MGSSAAAEAARGRGWQWMAHGAAVGQGVGSTRESALSLRLGRAQTVDLGTEVVDAAGGDLAGHPAQIAAGAPDAALRVFGGDHGDRCAMGNGHRSGARRSKEHDRGCRRRSRSRGRAIRNHPGGDGARRRDGASSRRAAVAGSRPRRWRVAPAQSRRAPPSPAMRFPTPARHRHRISAHCADYSWAGDQYLSRAVLPNRVRGATRQLRRTRSRSFRDALEPALARSTPATPGLIISNGKRSEALRTRTIGQNRRPEPEPQARRTPGPQGEAP